MLKHSGTANLFSGVLTLSLLLCAGATLGKGNGTFLEATFSGTIGSSRVSMKLRRTVPQRFGRFSLLDRQFPKVQRLEGFYYYERHRQDILLLGYFDDQGNWTVFEYAEPSDSPSGVFKGSLKDGKFGGKWDTPDGTRPAEFHLTEVKREIRTVQDSVRVARCEQEQAAQNAQDKNYRKAIFFLTLSRLAGDHRIDTQNWEELFQSLLDGKREEFRQKLASCEDEHCSELQLTRGPSAFLAEQDGDFDPAKMLYRDLCIHQASTLFQPVTFHCLMYAALGERIGDRKVTLEGYDLACYRTKSMCGKASGTDETDLVAAIREQKHDVVEKLLARPLNINANNGEILESAVLRGDLKLVQMLIEKQADPNLHDGRILEEAIANRHLAIAEFLLDHGADPKILPTGPGPLYLAVEAHDIPLIETLISKGADVNGNDYVGSGTPLMRAAEANQLEIVKLLLRHGADPTIAAKFHAFPLEATSDPEIKKLLNQAIANCRNGTQRCEATN